MCRVQEGSRLRRSVTFEVGSEVKVGRIKSGETEGWCEG